MQIFSLWAVSDKRYGGLGFSTTDVGNVIAISGILEYIQEEISLKLVPIINFGKSSLQVKMPFVIQQRLLLKSRPAEG